jgi:hypothetical protein
MNHEHDEVEHRARVNTIRPFFPGTMADAGLTKSKPKTEHKASIEIRESLTRSPLTLRKAQLRDSVHQFTLRGRGIQVRQRGISDT